MRTGVDYEDKVERLYGGFDSLSTYKFFKQVKKQLKFTIMIIYGVDTTKKDLQDKTRMIVCSCEIADYRNISDAFAQAIKKLKSSDTYGEVVLWMTKEKFETIYK